jgi:dephospho-CoA kinase
MLVIGLTGGIGTGKSEVAKKLQDLGAKLIEADKLGHLAYQPHSHPWRLVIEKFGTDILGENDEVDRKKLGAIVFSDPSALATLNSIMQPCIADMARNLIKEYREKGQKVVVLEAAILIEAGWDELVDEIWVTTAPESEVVNRLKKRNNFSTSDIKARIISQLSEEKRIGHAEAVINNSGDLDNLSNQIEILWESRVETKK